MAMVYLICGMVIGAGIVMAILFLDGRPDINVADIQTTLLFVDVHTVMHDQAYPSGVSVVPVDVPANKTINDCVTSIDL